MKETDQFCGDLLNHWIMADFLRDRSTLHMTVDTKNRTTPVIIAYFRPRFISKFTSRLARMTPKKLAEKPDQNGMPKTDAMIAPVHAPVPGNGTATNNINPSHWNSSTGAAFRRARSNRRSISWVAAVLLWERKLANFFR